MEKGEDTLHTKGTSLWKLGEATREKERTLENNGYLHLLPQKARLSNCKDMIFDHSIAPFLSILLRL